MLTAKVRNKIETCTLLFDFFARFFVQPKNARPPYSDMAVIESTLNVCKNQKKIVLLQKQTTYLCTS